MKWTTDDSPGFGGSRADHEKEVIAGNTFDYPAVHGASMLKQGWSFTSTSNETIEDSSVVLTDYKLVDWILGKQKQTKTGRGGIKPLQFKTFTTPMQKQITSFCKNGGAFFTSGAYVASDLWDNPEAGQAQETDKEFAKKVLKYNFREGRAAITGQVMAVRSVLSTCNSVYGYYNELNDKSYVVESPDGIVPDGENAYTIYRYPENNISAGVAYKGSDYRTCILGFPFESLKESASRDEVMKNVLEILTKK